MPRALKELDSASPFGGWLRRARTARGLTLEGLAEKADVSQPTISNLERGTRNPSRNMVERLATALVPDGLDEDEAQEAFRRLYNEGIRAAFPTEGGVEYEPFLEQIREAGVIEDLPPETQQEILDYIRFKAEQERRRRGGA